MLNYLKNETNYAMTENGAIAKATTGSSLLDFFASAGAYRTRSETDVISAFTKALSEDSLLAIKMLFYFRDVRGGQGERRLFNVISKYLADRHPELLKKNLHLFTEYGRWDDLYSLFGTKLESEVSVIIKEQIQYDIKSDKPSLLAKWLKSENTSSNESKRLGAKTRKMLEMSPRQYRKTLSLLRKKLNVLEVSMSANEWGKIEYPSVPSQASLKYRKAFYKHDEEGYQDYLDKLTKGEVKVNTGTLYPYQLVSKVDYEGYGWNRKSSVAEEQLLNEMWKSLPDYIGDKKENSLAVIDTSGSMHGDPIEVAISLGMYMAERNTGIFHDHFITFSNSPKLQHIQGANFVERVKNISKAEWGHSTNIESVFNLILNTAVKNNLSQDEMVEKLYIISDMEFNRCVTGGENKTLIESMRKLYQYHGYRLPKLVFWNVNARNTQFPVTMNDTGVQLVSGCSPSLFEQIMKGKEAYDLMIDTLSQPRYSAITI